MSRTLTCLAAGAVALVMIPRSGDSVAHASLLQDEFNVLISVGDYQASGTVTFDGVAEEIAQTSGGAPLAPVMVNESAVLVPGGIERVTLWLSGIDGAALETELTSPFIFSANSLDWIGITVDHVESVSYEATYLNDAGAYALSPTSDPTFQILGESIEFNASFEPVQFTTGGESSNVTGISLTFDVGGHGPEVPEPSSFLLAALALLALLAHGHRRRRA